MVAAREKGLRPTKGWDITTAGRRRRAGAAESPEEARGRLTRKLFALYDQHRPFRNALQRLADEHREALADLAASGIDFAFGSARIRAATSPAVTHYVDALEQFAKHWGLSCLPDNQGLNALHAWCLLSHANRDSGGIAFGAGHLVSSLVAGVDTTVWLGDFIAQWDPEEAALADQLLPVPEHLLAEIGHHPGLRLRTVRGQRGWYVPAEGARTRIRKAASEAKGARLTPQEQGLLDQQLARIEAEFAAVRHRHPDTAPHEDTHLRWAFLRLAPVGRGRRPLGVWQIALAAGADEKTVRNATDRLRKRLGIARFPSSSRKPERGPRSKPSR